MTVLSAWSVFAQELEPETIVPPSVGPVSDYAGLIDDARVDQLIALLKELQEKTDATVDVLTRKTGPTPRDQTQAEAYAARVYAKWKLGTTPSDSDIIRLVGSNILLLVTVDDARQTARTVLYLGQTAQELIDKFASPAFERKEYAKGIYETTWAMALVMAQAYKVTLTGKPPFEGDPLAGDSGSQNIAIWLILLVVVAAFVFHRLKQRKPGESLLPWANWRKRARNQTTSQWRGAFSRGNWGGFGRR